MDPLPPVNDHEDKSSLLKNCIRNNYQHLRKWGNRTKTNCFRIYDRDIKEFPIAIDFYDQKFCVHFFTFSREEETPKEELLENVAKTLSDLFGATEQAIHWRTRIKREKVEQYEKQGRSKEFFQVQEYGVKFWVNLTDYLDTGLFLDHRESRRYIASLSPGKKVLNLFSYTAAFSVHAALNGAKSTTSVDMSNTYNAWAEDNFILNNLSLKTNAIIRADCLKFLETNIPSYDIIIIDPPTLSRSKKMEGLFDIQEDYPFLLSKATSLLHKNGFIFFSTNSRKFHFDASVIPNAEVIDLSKKTFPLDFRSAKIHHCWKITPL